MKVFRLLAYVSGLIAVVFLLLLSCAPTIVSTKVGQRVCLSIANRFYDGSISFQNLSLSWFSGGDIKDLVVKDPLGRALLTCEHFVFKQSLIKFLFCRDNIGSVTIQSPAIYCYSPSEKQESPSHKQLSHSSDKQKRSDTVAHPAVLPNVKGQIAISNGSFIKMHDKNVLGAITAGNLTIDLDLLHTSKGTCTANILQHADSKTPLLLSFTLQGNQDISKLQGSLHVACENIPTEVIALFAESINGSLPVLVREAFGATVSYTLDASLDGSKAKCQSHLDSGNVRSQIEATLTDSTITIKEGPLFVGTLTPTLFSSLASTTQHYNIELSTPTSILIENRSPLSFDINTCNFLSPFNLRLGTQNPLLVSFDKNIPITCSLEGVVQGDPASPTGTFTVKATTPSAMADMSFDGSAVDLGSTYHLTSRFVMHGDWPSIASMMSKQPFTKLIGPNLALTSICEGDVQKDGSRFSLLTTTDLSTQNILGKATIAFDEKTLSSKNISIKAMIPTEACEAMVPGMHFLVKDESLQGTVSVNELSFPWDDIKKASLSVNGSVSVPSLQASQDYSCSLSKGSFTISKAASTFTTLFSGMVSGQIQSATQPFIQTAIGSDGFTAKIEGSLDLNNKTIHLSDTEMSGALCSISLHEATVVPDKEVSLSSPLVITLHASPLLFQNCSLPIDQPCLLSASISPFSITKQKGLWTIVGKIHAEAHSPSISLPGNQDIGFSTGIDILQQQIDASIHLVDNTAKVDCFNATLSSTLPESPEDLTGPVSIQFQSNGQISPNVIESIKSTLHLSTPFSIKNPVSFTCNVPKCTVTLQSFFQPNTSVFSILSSSALKTNLSISPVTLCCQGSTLGAMATLTGQFELDGPTHFVSYSLSTPNTLKEDSIHVDLQGKCENMWNNDGLTPLQSRLQSTFDVSEVPTRLFEIVMPDKGQLFEKSLGKTLHISGFAAIEKMKTGSVKFNLTAKHCSVSIDGTIQDGVLSLKSPATASLEITEKAGGLLLKDVNPLLATALSSKQPIRLTIDSAGTSIPIYPFAITSVRLPKITADVGQLVVQNGGALKVILALLGLGKAASGETLDLWLTPMYLRLEHGIVTCQRADALAAEKLHLITWGTVDLNHDTIDMVIAIPQDCLKNLHIEIITATPDRGLQIPITGSSSNPNIETKRATAKLAGAGMFMGGNVHAALIGGLIQAAASVGDDDQPIPPPTTQPFPWIKGL